MGKDVEATITAYPDGPYLVRGSFRIVDLDGNEVQSTGQTVALCRCGRSGQKPWCDGTHRSCNFRDSGLLSRPDPPPPA
ncbi:MAG TPA: CDGSH iron-sulfur domain-containing protein [Acidimicrobiales bacterium]|nr:CDGSH iron-sulfur domain-containing protein [Acidimicrobiales bacterium]